MKKNLKIYLASPRGFCAGVKRAIEIVEKSLSKYGKPVYVRHEIVHNKQVVNDLKKKGAVFVEELSDIKDNTRPVVFSAHGVPKTVPEEAKIKKLSYVDATCPLVTKVHGEVNKLSEQEHTIIMIGHKGHPEVEGTMGQINKNSSNSQIHLVESVRDVKKLNLLDSNKLSYVSQTTLSMNDTKKIIDSLKNKYPLISGPKNDDICYATQNRQEAVKKMLGKHDLIFVIGSKNSSNSNRLAEIAKEKKIDAILIDNMSDFKESWLKNKKNIGVTAGASAPELLVQELITEIKKTKDILISEIKGIEETIIFKLPKI